MSQDKNDSNTKQPTPQPAPTPLPPQDERPEPNRNPEIVGKSAGDKSAEKKDSSSKV